MHPTIIQTLALGLGSSWVAGINLYATVAVLGMLGRWGGLDLPGELEVLTSGWVIGVASGLYTIEFIADKVPWLDSAWDVAHTFIRVPAGVVLAASAFGDYDPTIRVSQVSWVGPWQLVTHTTKAVTQGMINASPEPITNVIASGSEDAFTVCYVSLAYFRRSDPGPSGWHRSCWAFVSPHVWISHGVLYD